MPALASIVHIALLSPPARVRRWRVSRERAVRIAHTACVWSSPYIALLMLDAHNHGGKYAYAFLNAASSEATVAAVCFFGALAFAGLCVASAWCAGSE